jgi:tRNA(His) guanylyltransferase
VVALNLMNSCAVAVSEEFPDIVFSYGFSDEYRYFEFSVDVCLHFIFPWLYESFRVLLLGDCSFVFKKTSKFYQRRARF